MIVGKEQNDGKERLSNPDMIANTYLFKTHIPCFGDIRIYAVIFTLLTTAYGLYWGYITAVLTFIERRYQMSSSMSGFMISSPEIGRVTVLLFVSHFGNRFNMARIIAIAFTLVGIAVFCQSIPHYAIKPTSAIDNSIGAAADPVTAGLCHRNISSNNSSNEFAGTTDDNTGSTVNTMAAYGMFIAATMMMGASAAPYYSIGFTYIEKNTESVLTGRYLGWANSGWAFGPMIGLFIAFWCSTINVDLEDTTLTPDDPSWIGAWWLGLVVISACQLTVAPLLCCFPRDLPVKEDQEEIIEREVPKSKVSPIEEKVDTATKTSKEKESTEPTEEETKELYGFKGLFRSLLILFKNPVYMCLMIGFAISNLYIGGFLTFIPKYTQEQFSIPAPRAIVITALISGIGTGVSGILGGQIISWLKLSVRGLFVMIIILSTFIIASSIATVFLGCENMPINGVSSANSDLENTCNRDCGCDLTLYSPVCDDGMTYFSSCHAGCIDHNVTQGENIQGMLLSCKCTSSGTAKPGACPTDCTMLIPASAIIICVFLGSGAIFPAMYLLLMRVVDARYTSLALGLSTMATALLGWMPGGSVYGAIIDTTCLVWQRTSSGEAGFCWIYDLPAFRYKIMGLNTGCFVVLFVFVLIAFMIRKRGVLGNYNLKSLQNGGSKEST